MLSRLFLGLAAIGILAYCAGLVLLDEHLPNPGEAVDRNTLFLFIGATLAAAALHVVACLVAHRRPPKLRYVLLVGAAARLLLLFGAPDPVLEGDVARLRYDARMVNSGLNPYEFKPAHLMDTDPSDVLMTGFQLERLARARAAMTASNDAPRPERLARPDLRTDSGPLALWAGSIADRFKPQSTRGFAFLVLVGDTIAVFLLVLALRSLQYPVSWVIVYAWSPVLLKESYLTLSPDALLPPALAALACCIATRQRLLAAVPLAICGGLRSIFCLLVPIFWRRIGTLGVLLAVILCVLPFLPFHTPDVPPSNYVEGQLHAWRHFEYNSMLENPLRGLLRQVPSQAQDTMTIAGVSILQPGAPLHGLYAKILGLAVLVGVGTYLAIRDTGVEPWRDAAGGLTDLFVIVAALLVTSPVLQAWHAVWILPILVLRPSGVAWLALPGLVCMSYVTHLAGPTAADFTVFSDSLSFRVVEYGLFVGLVALDLCVGRRLLPVPEGAAGEDLRAGSEEEYADLDYAEIEDEYAATYL